MFGGEGVTCCSQEFVSSETTAPASPPSISLHVDHHLQSTFNDRSIGTLQRYEGCARGSFDRVFTLPFISVYAFTSSRIV
jgi:hypothetical protein